MDKFIQLLTALLSEFKSPKDMLRGMVTVLVAAMLYLLVGHTTEVFSFLSTFSTTAVLQDLQEQRKLNFPNIAREKAMILFSQSKADAVYVVKYKPDAVNDYQNIVAWEGGETLDKKDLNDKAVNKISPLYRTHLEGLSYTVGEDQSNTRPKYSEEGLFPLKDKGYKYVYTCPYFNLNNIYIGYIGLAWKEYPVDAKDNKQFEDYLFRLCESPRRALGRSI